MIYIIYLAIAAAVVLISVKLSEYVDLLDRTTDISGAFIGGVMLAAVTSLPELFTSIAATLFVNQPDLVIGNVLGAIFSTLPFWDLSYSSASENSHPAFCQKATEGLCLQHLRCTPS